MQNIKLYTGKELVEHGTTKMETVIPVKGSKEVVPTRTWLEQKQIENTLEDRKLLINERIEKCGNLSHAEWLPDKRLARYVERRGSYIHFFGFPSSGEFFLYPEEALHLMEVNNLLLKYNGVVVSIQQGYSLLLDDTINLDEYRVYSFLSRKGYKILRHKEVKDIMTAYEKSINMKPLEKNRNFFKNVNDGHNTVAGSKSIKDSFETTCEWRSMPVQLVGCVRQIECVKRPIKPKCNNGLKNDSNGSNIIRVDKYKAVNRLNKIKDIVEIDSTTLKSNNGSNDSDDCVIVKGNDSTINSNTGMDVDCIPIETENLVTMPNVYRRGNILIVTPDESLLPPNIRPTQKTYKINVRSLSTRASVARKARAFNNRRYNNTNNSSVEWRYRPQNNYSASSFANHMFRQILQRQAFMANYWPPTFRHNCPPRPSFYQNSNAVMQPFMGMPPYAYPMITQRPNTVTSLQSNMWNDNQFNRNNDIMASNSRDSSRMTVSLRDPRTSPNKQLAQIRGLIAKFDLLRTTSRGLEQVSIVENIKAALDNLLSKFNENYNQSHTVDSLRNSSDLTIDSLIVDLSSNSDVDSDSENSQSRSFNHSRAKRRKKNNEIENSSLSNQSTVSSLCDGNDGPSQNSSGLQRNKVWDDYEEVTSTTDIPKSFPQNWSSVEESWQVSKSLAINTRNTSILYAMSLLSYTRKLKNTSVMKTWKDVKKAFEENVQKNTVSISDDEDDDLREVQPKVLLGLKTVKVQPLIRQEDCKSTSTIQQRLAIIRNVNIDERIKKMESLDESYKFRISFDVFAPSAKNIKKQDLVKPLFRVICQSDKVRLPNLLVVSELIGRFTDEVPLKWASVGPGTISFLQLGNVKIPTLCRQEEIDESLES